MTEKKGEIKFYFKKGANVRFKKEFALFNGGTIIEGAVGKVKFIGSEMSIKEVRAMFPDKVDYLSRYKAWKGNKKVAPRSIKIEYSPEAFVTDRISEKSCFYEIFIADINHVTFPKRSNQMESLIHRVPLKFQEFLELVESEQ